MVLEVRRRRLLFRTNEIWFSEAPYRIPGYHQLWFRVCTKKVDIPGFRREVLATYVIELDKDLDKIWRSMSKSCRYDITRGTDLGLRVRLSRDKNDFKLFHEMDQEFRIRKGLHQGTGLGYMLSYGPLVLCESRGELIGGQLYVEDPSCLRWLVGASRRLQVSREEARVVGYGNRLMIWEAMKWAKAKGIRSFDLGGVYTGENQNDPRVAINRFKLGFGGTLVDRYTYVWRSRSFELSRAAKDRIPW